MIVHVSLRVRVAVRVRDNDASTVREVLALGVAVDDREPAYAHMFAMVEGVNGV